MARARRVLLGVTAGLFAFVFWVPSLALTDLVLGLIPAGSDDSSQAVGNLAYGIIGAVLVAPAFATQVRQPERRIAPLQQIALVALALGVAAIASGEPIGLMGVVVLLVPLAIALALHPRRRDVLRRADQPRVPLLVLAVGATIPAFVYAWRQSSSGRAGLPPEDSFAYVPSLWAAAAAMAIATVLVAWLAALGPAGWFVSATCVAVAAFLFGVASIVSPDMAASGGRAGGGAALLWSLVWLATAVGARRGSAGLVLQRP